MSRLSSVKNQQQKVLKALLQKAENTSFGRQNNFASIHSYAEFANQVSIASYDDIQPSIQQLKAGDHDIFWPGGVQRFAVSAGTSGEGKHLPLTDERLQSDRRFMHKVVKSYLRQRPNILDLAGAHISMPGSVEIHDDLQIGEISGFTALNAPSWLRIFQVVDPAELIQLNFQQKFNLLVDEAIEANLKVITAVPSWILTLFQEVLNRTGKLSIAEVWPDLKLLVCGGVKLANYRPHLQQLAGGLSLDFIETYGASEGYIGFSDDLKKRDLKMVINNGIFFECIPDPRPSSDTSTQKKPIPLWQAKTGIPYALLMTTNAGLWRYTLNDIIEFTSLHPLRFTVKGRVNDMLDDFGEALYIYEAEQALQAVAKNTNMEIGTFAISAVLQSETEVPYHQWFVRFIEPMNDKMLKNIGQKIDAQLQEINRHYAIRRESKALGAPKIKSITQNQINEWLTKHGKANAQGKLPRILPNNVERFA